MRSAGGLVALVLPLLVSASLGTAIAVAAPATTLATVDGMGGVIGQGTSDQTMTPDGRYVAFVTLASLDGADGNGQYDVYRRDRRTGAITWVSRPLDGEDGVTGNSAHPSISDDGDRVAFESTAENLVHSAVQNGGSSVFVRDVAAGTTTLASRRLDGSFAGPGGTMLPVLSGNGRVIAFQAPDFAIAPTFSTTVHLFARDLSQPGVERVDVSTAGTLSGQEVSSNGPPTISADGRVVAWATAGANLVAGDGNAKIDVFVRDRATGTTRRASVASGGGEGTGGDAVNPVVSADGGSVAFQSFAPNLVAMDTNGLEDVFVRDLRAGQTTRVSVFPNGSEILTASSRLPAISADGRYVAYTTFAKVLNTDSDGADDVYLYDQETGAIQRLSVADTGDSGDPGGTALVVGPTGRLVLFATLAPFVAADANGAQDAYLRDAGTNTPPVATPVVTPSGGLEATVDGGASRDPDGWIETYAWSFGDGGAATGPRGPYAFRAPGRYAVVLTVTDNDGATGTASTTIDIPAAGESPAATGPSPAPAGALAPRNTRRPAITGRRRAGATLRCSPGRWEDGPRFAYAWLRDGRPVRRATTSTYRVRASDRGHRLACRVTARVPGRPDGRATSTAVRVPRPKATSKRKARR